MKNYQKIIVSVILPVLSLCACNKNKPDDSERVDFHTELQTSYLNDSYKNMSPYADGTKELSKPKGYQISFANHDHIEYVVFLESDIDNRSYVCNLETFTFNNLYLNTKYHYEIRKDGVAHYQGDFLTTNVAPRNIDVEGVTNFRDLGGHPTLNGGYTKQGMIYRSAKFNANESDTPLITDKGRDVVVDELHMKAEIDLRLVDNNENGHITKSVIDSSVKYYSVPMNYSGDVLSNNRDEVVHLFDIISQRENYPFVFHCSIGTDRTGFVGMLLNALLEVKPEAIYRDYMFSNFGNIGSSRSGTAIDGYINALSGYEATTLKEQTRAYLISIGVAPQKIQSFLDIMK